MSDYRERVYPRVRVKATIDVQAEDLLLFHRIENISLGGVCVEIANPPPIGSPVELGIDIPESGEELVLNGEVAWIAEGPPATMGVRFVDLDGETKERLRDYLYKSKDPGS